MDAEDWTEFFGILTAEEDYELSWIQAIEDERMRAEARNLLEIQKKHYLTDAERHQIELEESMKRGDPPW